MVERVGASPADPSSPPPSTRIVNRRQASHRSIADTALAEDPQHVRAWQIGAVGEEEFGRRLSGCSGPALKVLHDRKLPRSSANIDHLAVTTETV